MPRSRKEIEASMVADGRRLEAWEKSRKTREDGGRYSKLGYREVSLSGSKGGTPPGDEPIVYDEGGRFVPLVSNMLPLTADQRSEEIAARVDHVLSFLTEKQRETLRRRWVEGLTLAEMATAGESRQAVHQQVSWARKAFEREWLKHSDDIEEERP